MEKILLIENDLLTVRMYQRVFAFENYHIEIAFDEEEGMQKAKSVKPAIILLDVVTPHDSRFKVLERLKLDPETRDFPVVVMANIYEQEYVEIALSKGAVKYIDKFDNDPKQVAEMVREIIVSTTSSY